MTAKRKQQPDYGLPMRLLHYLGSFDFVQVTALLFLIAVGLVFIYSTGVQIGTATALQGLQPPAAVGRERHAALAHRFDAEPAADRIQGSFAALLSVHPRAAAAAALRRAEGQRGGQLAEYPRRRFPAPALRIREALADHAAGGDVLNRGVLGEQILLPAALRHHRRDSACADSERARLRQRPDPAADLSGHRVLRGAQVAVHHFSSPSPRPSDSASSSPTKC